MAGILLLACFILRCSHGATPANDYPNPYHTIEHTFKLRGDRTWGATSAIDIDPDGRSIWVAERCEANSCVGSGLDVVFKFNEKGNLIREFGGGLFLFPHGIHVDSTGNVWVTDAQGPDGQDPLREGKGHQIIKFSPDGKILMKLGVAGVAGDGSDELLHTPCDVVTTVDGTIFVADGHGGQSRNATPDTVARIVKFDSEGNYLMHWGGLGSGPGKFRTPHGLAFDSSGRLFVADRGNSRIQIFDQEGNFIQSWKQFGRPSGLTISADNTLYVADSESNEARNPGFKRGIRIGSAVTGKVTHFIPDPEENPKGTSAAEGVAVDSQGHVYGAEVGPRGVKRYVRQ